MGNTIAPYLLFITLCSWYNFFIAARTLSNTVETMFTVIALNYWPSNVYWCNFLFNIPHTRNYRISLLWASLACVMRPTNALIWIFSGLQLAARFSGRRIAVLLNAAIIVAIILTANIALDTFIYSKELNVEKLVLTPINFFKINVLQSISLIYGVHPWHWYISQGVPVILTTMLPFALYGYRCTPDKAKDARSLGHLIIWVLGAYSLLSHKEFRFIFPVVPLMLIFVANGLSNIPTRWRKLSAIALMVTQVPMALYLSLWHQRGVTDVMLWIREQANNSSVHSVGVLMPCHSTPWQSVVHRSDVDMWFLTCEPPLHSNEEEYIDEADRFYASPALFLEKEIGQPERPWPTHLVLFENLLEMDNAKIKEMLTKSGYRECARFFNSHFHDDWRRRGDVLVYCR
ncbi:Alg9-like mannosyltransferase family-domain-containing protein [Circinella umbellata]|nr:Alg9-like mannosyltransferase family-domain-containing protein [Circinella umbellata]